MNTVAGVFVEPRMVEQIYFNIENFFKVLPDNNLYFFCGKNTVSPISSTRNNDIPNNVQTFVR